MLRTKLASALLATVLIIAASACTVGTADPGSPPLPTLVAPQGNYVTLGTGTPNTLWATAVKDPEGDPVEVSFTLNSSGGESWSSGWVSQTDPSWGTAVTAPIGMFHPGSTMTLFLSARDNQGHQSKTLVFSYDVFSSYSPGALPAGVSYATPVTYANYTSPSTLNSFLTVPTPEGMTAALGSPGTPQPGSCQGLYTQNPRINEQFTQTNVGGTPVVGLRPAVTSVNAILHEIQVKEPGLYNLLGTAGMACFKLKNGTGPGISNHAWGAAIDMTISPHGAESNTGTQAIGSYGLLRLAQYFTHAGWFWGAGYSGSFKDSMHFEVSALQMMIWVSNGAAYK